MEVDDAIRQRKSVRDYKTKKPDWRLIMEALDGARFAPMAGNNFNLKFVVVSEQDTIEKIADAAQQEFLRKAPYLIIVCADVRKVINVYGENGVTFAKQQAGAAIQNIFLKLHDLGLASCWVGYFVEEQVKAAAGIPRYIDVEAILPIGYPLGKSRPMQKVDLGDITFFEKYGNDKMNKINRVD